MLELSEGLDVGHRMREREDMKRTFGFWFEHLVDVRKPGGQLGGGGKFRIHVLSVRQ